MDYIDAVSIGDLLDEYAHKGITFRAPTLHLMQIDATESLKEEFQACIEERGFHHSAIRQCVISDNIARSELIELLGRMPSR